MKRVLVTGAGGLVGRALVNELQQSGYDVIPLESRAECDLAVQSDVFALMRFVRPDAVCHLAAAVFGVGGNLSFPGEVFYKNTLMNTCVLESARQFGVKKVVAMGSAAMYADGLTQPMLESDCMHGEPHGSEYAYAYSKRAMLAQLQSYEAQYGLAYGYVVATNMYGPYDRFDANYGHVIPSLLIKFFEAEQSGGRVEIWGDGSPTRDFLYANDAAFGLRRILEDGRGVYNLATGASHSIRQLVSIIAANFSGVDYYWNTDKPLGQLQRAYDVSRLNGLGFTPFSSLENGIRETVNWLRENTASLRK